MPDIEQPQSSIILYQTEDGRTRIQCRFDLDTIWLTQVQIAELFQTSVPNINLHLKAIYSEDELTPAATIKSYLIVRIEGARQISRAVLHYSLPAILAVGYRVRSHRGTQFRQWATARLSEYLVKGFTMDDERLKNPPGKGQTDYFDELLERIRDIRSSERRFYQKVLDIYATSVDYTPNTEMTKQFFAAVQNKMHWAIRREDVSVAKNYLTEEELQTLNRIVSLSIEFAELQALDRKPITMCQCTENDMLARIVSPHLLYRVDRIGASNVLDVIHIKEPGTNDLVLDAHVRRLRNKNLRVFC
jgi:hypothetical protein